jgi:hypothetical protein
VGARAEERELLEASGGFEPPIRVLQTPALPLGYDAGMWSARAPKHSTRSRRWAIAPMGGYLTSTQMTAR